MATWFALFANASVAADALDAADKAANEWLTLQMETARLEADWRTQRELLASILVAQTERLKSAEEKRDLALAKTARERSELQSIEKNTQDARADLKLVGARLEAATARVLTLRPNLPPHLSDALEMSYRSLASKDAVATERMQIVVNVLNRCAQFNRLVTVADDVLSLAGEPPAKSYEVIYWGLSRAFAIDHREHKAWLGTPGERGWEWTRQPEAFAATEKALAIARGTADPEFVSLPGAVPRMVSPQK